MLGTSLARPAIAKRAVEIAHAEGCRFVAHGATGKGNDQVRFELTFAALDPTLGCVVPWRDPAFYSRFKGRGDLIDYAASKGLPVVQTKAKPYSMDENMLHISYEAGILEDPANAAPRDMYRMTVDPADAPDVAAMVTVTFEKGVPVRVQNPADGTGEWRRRRRRQQRPRSSVWRARSSLPPPPPPPCARRPRRPADITDPLELFLYCNKIGGAHGIGRADVVENRFVGIKSRGVYESPGGELLRQAHIGLEGLTLDREVFRLRDTMSARFADLCYNGFWYSPEMDFILAAVKKSQERVSGSTTVGLFKGKASIVSRSSPLSLYNQNLSSMDAQGAWNPADSTGFIRINAVRLKAHYVREQALLKK